MVFPQFRWLKPFVKINGGYINPPIVLMVGKESQGNEKNESLAPSNAKPKAHLSACEGSFSQRFGTSRDASSSQAPRDFRQRWGFRSGKVTGEPEGRFWGNHLLLPNVWAKVFQLLVSLVIWRVGGLGRDLPYVTIIPFIRGRNRNHRAPKHQLKNWVDGAAIKVRWKSSRNYLFKLQRPNRRGHRKWVV